MAFKRHHQVVIYTSHGSKMCELAKAYFRDAGIEFIEIDVTRDKTAENKMIEISDQNQTPVVEIDGRAISGYHPEIYETIINTDNEARI
jgi:glutaredoxin